MTDTPVTSQEFTLTQAQMIVRNPDSYERATVRRAALWMLGSLTAPKPDITAATHLL